MLSIHCRLIIILSIYVWLTLTLAKVCPHSHLITIEEIHKVLSKPKKDKQRLNMIAKSLLRKQVLILMSFNNSEKFMVLFNKHIANINKTLKDIKLDIVANFI